MSSNKHRRSESNDENLTQKKKLLDNGSVAVEMVKTNGKKKFNFAPAPVGKYKYINGWGGYNNSEARPGTVPPLGNTPQKCPYGLYAEQISGTAFTKVQHENQRSWKYRIRPAAGQRFVRLKSTEYPITDTPCVVQPQNCCWKPLPFPTKPTTFVEGMQCYMGSGSAEAKHGIRIYVYACNSSMVDSSFSSADGDMLIVPEAGTLDIKTEFGRMEVPPGFICVIQRGIQFQVELTEAAGGETRARGYVCEVFDGHFITPPLGVIGANGLSNLKDFETPTAWFEDRECQWKHFTKVQEEMFVVERGHSPFDVVGWSGNYAPFRYDLAKYCVINSVSFDHLDPSIFCVVTAQTNEPGVAACDFVIFPPRYMVQEDTFRPPYFHQNTMSEFMGIIKGEYEAKPGTKGEPAMFRGGGATLHSCMTGHGPSTAAFLKASESDTSQPTAPNNSQLAFMFETVYQVKLTKWANTDENLNVDYVEAWNNMPNNYRKLN